MSPVSRGVYEKVRSSLASTIEKNKDNLLSKVVPFNCVIAQEIGLKMDPKSVSAFNAMPSKDRYSAQSTFPLIDVINAMEEYGFVKYGMDGFDSSDNKEEDSNLPVDDLVIQEEKPEEAQPEEAQREEFGNE